MKRGAIVRFWYDADTTAAGMLHGVVEKSGPKTFTARWEAGFRSRVVNGYGGVTLEKDPELIVEARRKLALPKTPVEVVVAAFVEHHGELREAFDSLVAGGRVTEAKVEAHSEAQKAEIASFDAWLLAAGWTRAELWEALRGIVKEIRRREGGTSDV